MDELRKLKPEKLVSLHAEISLMHSTVLNRTHELEEEIRKLAGWMAQRQANHLQIHGHTHGQGGSGSVASLLGTPTPTPTAELRSPGAGV